MLVSQTSIDIARLAGVSQSTVSRVLRGHPNVSPKTREHVLKVLAEAEYVPNARARAMRTRRSGAIGVVMGSIGNPFYPELLARLSQAIANADHLMALWTADGPAGEASAIEAMRSGTIDGLLFTTANPGNEPLNQALSLGLPIVLVNRTIEGVPCDQVTSDSVNGARLMARYLWQHGHRNVAVLGGTDAVGVTKDRRRGFLDEFREHGIEIPQSHQPMSDVEHDTARDAGLKLLQREDRPSAIFCVNDLVAFGVLDAAEHLNIRVPEDLWIAGYDDIKLSQWDCFDLTTMRQPIETMADTAVETLLKRIGGRSSSFEHRRFATELVVRGTTDHQPMKT